jgi:hypothetical protein
MALFLLLERGALFNLLAQNLLLLLSNLPA